MLFYAEPIAAETESSMNLRKERAMFLYVPGGWSANWKVRWTGSRADESHLTWNATFSA
jgi:hypothetical protein